EGACRFSGSWGHATAAAVASFVLHIIWYGGWYGYSASRLPLLKHPYILVIHAQPRVRPVSHAGTLDPHPLNESQSLSLQLLGVPLRHPHDLAAANVVLAVNDHDSAGPKYPNALSPNPSMRLSIRLSPLQLASVSRMKRPSQHVAVSIAARSVSGVVMVGHAVGIGRARHDCIKLAVTRPRHVCRVAYVHLDMCRCLCGPFRLDLVSHNAASETVITEQANFSNACHRIKDAARCVLPQDAGEHG